MKRGSSSKAEGFRRREGVLTKKGRVALWLLFPLLWREECR